MYNKVDIYDKKVIQVSADGSIIQEYTDIETISRIFFISAKKLHKICVSKNTSVKFLKSFWFFKDDYNDKIKNSIIINNQKGDILKQDNSDIYNSKQIVKIDANGNILETFESINDACSKDSKLKYINIYKTCIGLQNTHRGYIWLFEDECDDESIKVRKKIIKNRETKSKILQLDVKCQIINIFENMKDASDKLNLSHKAVINACSYSTKNATMLRNKTFLVKETSYLKEKDVILNSITKKLESKYLDINPIYYLTKNGEIIKEFMCIKDASDETGETCDRIKTIAEAQRVAIYITGHRWAYKAIFDK